MNRFAIPSVFAGISHSNGSALGNTGSLGTLCLILCDNSASPKRRDTMARRVCKTIDLSLLHVRLSVRPTQHQMGQPTRTQSVNQKQLALGMHR